MVDVDEAPVGWVTVGRDRSEEGPFVIAFGGEIDLSVVDELRSTVDGALPEAMEALVFDLSAVEFMDSSGITLLLELGGRATTVAVRRPSDSARRVIEATGLTTLLPVEPC